MACDGSSAQKKFKNNKNQHTNINGMSILRSEAPAAPPVNQGCPRKLVTAVATWLIIMLFT